MSVPNEHAVTNRIQSAPVRTRQQILSALENIYVHLRCADALGCAGDITMRTKTPIAADHLAQTLEQCWTGKVKEPFPEHYLEAVKVCDSIASQVWNPSQDEGIQSWAVRMSNDASRIRHLADCQKAKLAVHFGEPVEPVNERDHFLASGAVSDDAILAYESMRSAWSDIANQKNYCWDQALSSAIDEIEPLADDPSADDVRDFLSQIHKAEAMPCPVTFAEILHRSNLNNVRALSETNQRIQNHWTADCPQLTGADVQTLLQSFTSAQHSYELGEEPDALIAKIACGVKRDSDPAWADSMTFWGYRQCGEVMLEPIEAGLDQARDAAELSSPGS